MSIGIDLDDTIISITKGGSSWRIKEGCRNYLSLLSREGYTLHIITDREGSPNDVHALGTICKQLEITGIHIDRIVCTNGEKKGKCASLLQCKYMIDNDEDALSDCIENDIIPIHLKLNGKKRSNKTTFLWKEANSWREAYEIINQE
jgi:hypothetical protein